MTPATGLGRLLLWLAAGVFIILQGKLWFGEGGILDVHRIKQAVAQQQAENLRLHQRNAVLEAEVNDLKNGQAAIEERARLDLGMIKDDETFYLITGKALAGSATATPNNVATPDTVQRKPVAGAAQPAAAVPASGGAAAAVSGSVPALPATALKTAPLAAPSPPAALPGTH